MGQRYYVPDPIPASGAFELPESEAHHALSVMRLKVGDELTIFDGRGNQAAVKVIGVGRRSIECQLCAPWETIDRERSRPLHVAIPLPKGERERWLIEKGVELGATSLTPLSTRRSIVKPDARVQLRLQRQVIEASKQCGRNVLMEIRPWVPFQVFVETTETTEGWLAHPGGVPLSESLAREPQYLLIGPEGGFAEEEVTLAVQHGWRVIDLGPRILRMETAVAKLLSCIGPSI